MNIRHDRPKKTIPLWYWIKAPPHSVDRRSGLNPYGGNSRCSSTSTLDTPAKASAEQWMMLMLLGFNVSSLGDQVSSTGWYGSIRWGLYGVNQSRWGVQCRPFETIEQSIHVSQCMIHTYRGIHTYLHTHTHTYTYTDTDTYTDTYTYYKHIIRCIFHVWTIFPFKFRSYVDVASWVRPTHFLLPTSEGRDGVSPQCLQPGGRQHNPDQTYSSKCVGKWT